MEQQSIADNQTQEDRPHPEKGTVTVTVDGHFKPLNDTDRIHIRGGEVFVSHVRTGGSS